jgi:dephospho-CoA kinase
VIELTEHTEEWSKKFNVLKQDLLSFERDVFINIEHIGSTAIPGVKAKDIVDIQCAIQSFGDIQRVREVLEPLGFNWIKEIKQDHVPFHEFDYFSPDWEKRFFKGNYKGQDFNIHIRLEDSLNWKFALAFRDFLSSNENARSSFMQFKERLAKAKVSDKEYCIIKDSVIDLLSLQFPS